MITNRPRPPRQLYSGTAIPNTALPYTYFSTEETTLSVYDMTTAADFEMVFEEKGTSGNLNYLVACCDNDSGSAVEFGMRIIIDGNTCWNFRNIACLATSEKGVILAGLMLWDTTNDQPFCIDAEKNLIWTESISVEGYVSTLTSCDVLVAYKYKITNRIGA